MKKHTRKEFLRYACLTGACLCGFSVLAFAEDKSMSHRVPDDNLILMQDWISSLLSNLNNRIDREEFRKIIKKSAIVHYTSLKMDDMLKDYENKLDEFNLFIGEKWGWKIKYNAVKKTIVADENKNYCVCPILSGIKDGSALICYCSEGFAETMFSKVIGSPVTATVISSVKRGDKSCRYLLEWNK